jgi:hypothetical protein
LPGARRKRVANFEYDPQNCAQFFACLPRQELPKALFFKSYDGLSCRSGFYSYAAAWVKIDFRAKTPAAEAAGVVPIA